MDAMKAKEKEMKDEKEAERQVRPLYPAIWSVQPVSAFCSNSATILVAARTGDQGSEGLQRGESSV